MYDRKIQYVVRNSLILSNYLDNSPFLYWIICETKIAMILVYTIEHCENYLAVIVRSYIIVGISECPLNIYDDNYNDSDDAVAIHKTILIERYGFCFSVYQFDSKF